MTQPSPKAFRRARRAGIIVALASVMVASLVAHAPTAAADAIDRPSAGKFTIKGAGFGHGWGMSQYGAYGAARKGKTWKQILAFYYPGTSLGTLSSRAAIKVWITADNDNELRVLPSTGLTLSDASGKTYIPPTGSSYRLWRVKRSGAGFSLHYRNPDGAWVYKKTGLDTSTWIFTNTASLIKVAMPNGSVREYRGSVRLVKRGTGGRTVNRVRMEDYVKSVVPSEMPTSWLPDAVRSQAVAARTYAARVQSTAYASNGYDICDTTNCQVYSGYAVTSGGRKTVRETSGGNNATAATAGRVLTYGSKIAFSQFSSSNGGHSATGSAPYLVAKPDPYDGVIKSQAWTRILTTGDISRAWPAVGTVTGLQITARDGAGSWGGRVKSVKIIGNSRSITVTGTSFQYRFGMRSNLFTITGAAPSATNPAGKAYATFPRSYSSASAADLLLINSSGAAARYPFVRGQLGSPTTIATGMGSLSLVVSAGDWNGDGYQDVIGRSSSGRLLLFRGTRSGQLASGLDARQGENFTGLTSVGDFNGDRYPDLVAIAENGYLYLLYGDGKLGFKGHRRLGPGWGSRDWLRSPGDMDGDGRPDIITKRGDALDLHSGTKTSFARATVLGSRGWNSMSTITSVGDVDGDRKADLIVRNRSSQLLLYRGTGAGRLYSGKVLSGSYTGTRFAV